MRRIAFALASLLAILATPPSGALPSPRVPATTARRTAS